MEEETSSSVPSSLVSNPNPNNLSNQKKKKTTTTKSLQAQDHEVGSPLRHFVERSWPRRGSGVMLEGYVEAADGGDQVSEGGDSVVGRTKSLTDEDLEELKGCLDLGFGFSYEEIPELCSTLPALELCYSMSQRFLDERQQKVADEAAAPAGDSCPSNGVGGSSVLIANWKFSSPGDHPEEVKARLKYWAQAVACTVRLCN